MTKISSSGITQLFISISSPGPKFQDYLLKIKDADNFWLQGNGLDSNSDKKIIGIRLDHEFRVYKASYLTTSDNDHVLKGVSVRDNKVIRVTTGTCKDSSNSPFQGVMIQIIENTDKTQSIVQYKALCFLPHQSDNFEPFDILAFVNERVALLLKETTSSKKLMATIIDVSNKIFTYTYEYGVNTETLEPLAFNQRTD